MNWTTLSLRGVGWDECNRLSKLWGWGSSLTRAFCSFCSLSLSLFHALSSIQHPISLTGRGGRGTSSETSFSLTLPPFPSQRRAEFLIYINTRTLMAVNCGKFTSPRERERISLNASTLPQLLFGRILMSYRYIFEMFYNHVCLKDNASLDDRNIIELNSFPFLLSLSLSFSFWLIYSSPV